MKIGNMNKKGGIDTLGGVIITIIIILILAAIVWITISGKLEVFNSLT